MIEPNYSMPFLKTGLTFSWHCCVPVSKRLLPTGSQQSSSFIGSPVVKGLGSQIAWFGVAAPLLSGCVELCIYLRSEAKSIYLTGGQSGQFTFQNT